MTHEEYKQDFEDYAINWMDAVSDAIEKGKNEFICPRCGAVASVWVDEKTGNIHAHCLRCRTSLYT